MAGIYKDAKAWLRNTVEDGTMSADELLDCIVNQCSNDDIEAWWNVSMESGDDNPGADRGDCSECGSEADLEYLQAHDGLCETCVDDQAEDYKRVQRENIVEHIYTWYKHYMQGSMNAVQYQNLQNMVEALEDEISEL